MRSSNLWKWVRAVLFVGVALGISLAISYGVIPNTFARVSIHQLQKDSCEDIYVGTSKGQTSIDPETVSAITGRKGHNLCLGSEFPIDSLYLIKEAMRTGKPTRVIYELDPSYYVVEEYEGIEDPFIANAMPTSLLKQEYLTRKYLKEDFRLTLFPWVYHRNGIAGWLDMVRSKAGEGYREFRTDVLGDNTQVLHESGFLSYTYIENFDKEYNPLEFKTENLNTERLQNLREMISYCQRKGIELVVVVPPVPEDALENNAMDYQLADAYFSAFCDTFHVDYINFNKIDTGFDNSLESYRDYEGHMWENAAESFSEILGQYLK